MKTINRILTVFMVLSILLCSVTTFASFAANDNQSDSESEIEELQPLMASGCSNYDYYNYTMNQLKVEKGWTLRMDGDLDHYNIYSGSTCIGKYHSCRNNSQQPHFHLYSTPGVHYILGGL